MLDKLQFVLSNMLFFFIGLLTILLIVFFLKKILKKYEKKLFVFEINFFKLSFIYSFLFLLVFIVTSHQIRDCDELDKLAKCQCYALEVSEAENIQDKNQIIKIAEIASKTCPNSTFFDKYKKLNN